MWNLEVSYLSRYWEIGQLFAKKIVWFKTVECSKSPQLWNFAIALGRTVKGKKFIYNDQASIINPQERGQLRELDNIEDELNQKVSRASVTRSPAVSSSSLSSKSLWLDLSSPHLRRERLHPVSDSPLHTYLSNSKHDSSSTAPGKVYNPSAICFHSPSAALLCSERALPPGSFSWRRSHPRRRHSSGTIASALPRSWTSKVIWVMGVRLMRICGTRWGTRVMISDTGETLRDDPMAINKSTFSASMARRWSNSSGSFSPKKVISYKERERERRWEEGGIW